MEWINLKVSTIRQPEYVGSDPTQRATWFNVLAYCIEQENHGRIIGAAAWKDRQWQQTCGVLEAEVKEAPLLLQVDGGDIVVWNYPSARQAEVQAKREAGRRGGMVRSDAKAQAARANGAARGDTPPKHRPKQNRSTSEAPAEAEAKQDPSSNPTERNRKGKGIGKEEEDKSASRSARVREVERELPASLDTDSFRAAWALWVDYAIEKNNGRSVPSQTFDAHLRTCLGLGPAAGAEALRTAISRNLREPAASLKISEPAGGAYESFDPTRPNAHTGGAVEAV